MTGRYERSGVVAAGMALLVAACASAATPPPAASTAPSGLAATGSFFALSVADLDAERTWYVEKLGLTPVAQPPTTDGVATVVLQGNGLTIELIHRDDGVSLDDLDPSLDDRTRLHGIVKAGAIVADFDVAVAMLQAQGVTIAFGPFAATASQPANLIFEDDEGNLIQLIGPAAPAP